ncbi:MAG: hypothetical protein DWH91_02225 [Planctomycetota bacterium]|nr:MAG: hypothetical protein DWH91_02225 [Planctomycetota bacterium]
MKRFVAVLALLCVAGFAYAEAEKKFEAKCIVSGGPAKQDKCVEYKGGKVYFCCENCPKAFASDKSKFATKANLQLVSTGQAKQAKCPLSGGKLNPEAKVTIGGVEVQFCCNNCKGKAAGTEGDAQIELVFSDAAFEKGGFAVPKKEEKK